MRNREDAICQLLRDLCAEGLDPDDYDVAALADDLHAQAGWNFDQIDDDEFAAFVRRHRVTTCPIVWCPVDHDKNPGADHSVGVQISTRMGLGDAVLDQPKNVQLTVIYNEDEDKAPMLAIAVNDLPEAYLTPAQAEALLPMLEKGIKILAKHWTDEDERRWSHGTIFSDL